MYEEEETVGIENVEEISLNQVFGKMIEIMQSMTERKGPRGEDKVLERFLKFQPPIFVGEAE
jgi:hypothetical protein